MNLMPRWMRQLPFADQIKSLYYLLLATALLGLVGTAIGPAICLILILPFALFVFLLWRTYIDDGYKEGKDG